MPAQGRRGSRGLPMVSVRPTSVLIGSRLGLDHVPPSADPASLTLTMYEFLGTSWTAVVYVSIPPCMYHPP